MERAPPQNGRLFFVEEDRSMRPAPYSDIAHFTGNGKPWWNERKLMEDELVACYSKGLTLEICPTGDWGWSEMMIREKSRDHDSTRCSTLWAPKKKALLDGPPDCVRWTSTYEVYGN